MIGGTAYGVVLNDRAERERLGDALSDKPYGRPPEAPVVYIKPRSCLQPGPARVVVPDGVEELNVAATVALLFDRDTSRCDAASAFDGVSAIALAIDVSVPTASHYRPDVMERCCDGFLPLGEFVAAPLPSSIATLIDGVEAHRWSLDRLVRDAAGLIADLSDFMTLRGGDLLLIGLPGDAPTARRGQAIEVHAAGLAPLSAFIAEEGA